MAEKLSAIVWAGFADSPISFLPFYILFGIIKPLTFLQGVVSNRGFLSPKTFLRSVWQN